jgi:dolichol kinase
MEKLSFFVFPNEQLRKFPLFRHAEPVSVSYKTWHIKNRAWLFMHDFFSLPMAEQENQARSARLENRLFYSGTLIKIYLSATPRAAAFYILTLQGRFLYPCVNQIRRKV